MSYEPACANPECEHYKAAVRTGVPNFMLRDESAELKTFRRVRLINIATGHEVRFCDRCAAAVGAFLRA